MKDNARFDSEKSKTVRKVATASFFCNFIEWFDYATYSYFAVVIAQVFFPNDDPALALIQTFAVFALSFLLRPIGAIFLGATWGDKKGRKWSLTVSVFMMAGATFCIGLLPGYAALGICAPALLLLLRMIQGFSASGEYAGAATFLAEYAPTDKRGMYCSIVPASTAIGLLVGSAFATVMYTIMPEAAVNEWGWRIPFVLAGPLGIGAVFREHSARGLSYVPGNAACAEKTLRPLAPPVLLSVLSTACSRSICVSSSSPSALQC